MIRLLVLSLCCLVSSSSLGAEGMRMNEQTKIDRALAERVKAEGVVRVIVEVRPSTPDELAAAGPASRGLCANEGCAVLRLQQSLPAVEAQSMVEIHGQPLVSMDLTEAGLDVLATSEYVERVIADEPVSTQPVEPERSREPGGATGSDLSAPQSR